MHDSSSSLPPDGRNRNSSIIADHLVIPALDGHKLAASRFTGNNPDGPVVLINSGAAIPRKFYTYFAEYLADKKASHIFTYDYRGIGGSWPGNDRKFSYLMSDWARHDFPAMLEWVGKYHPGRKIYVVGHSFGGQTIGLTDRNSSIDKIVTIAAMSGYWRKMQSPERYRVYAAFFLMTPILARIYGYIPGKFGLGEDMAAAAMGQWVKWCKDPDYFFSDPALPEIHHFSDYQGPILAVGLDDDLWGRPELIDHLTNHFTAADITRIQYSPSRAGGAVGHFNFFKPRFKETLWQPVADWLFEEIPV